MAPERPFTPESWEARDLGCVLHGFSHLPTLARHGPTVLSHGEGVYVYDIHGRRYLEANSGLWNAIAGFNHRGLLEAACQQIRRFPAYHLFFGRATEPSIELAQKLLGIAPVPMTKAFFTNSGSEANDTVVKMLWMINRARGQPQRRKIISQRNGYHGVTAVTASMTGKDYVAAFGLPLEGFLWADCPHYWRFGLEGESEEGFTARLAGNLDALILAEGPETIAGFFAEPVMGAGGVIVPPKGYFPAIQTVLRRYDIPLIADEVICGLGRTGNLWGCQTCHIKPDILVTSKCLTAGYFPMGAILISEAIDEQLQTAADELGEFPHGFTTAGHPVGCAIALKAIDLILDEGLFDNVIKIAPHFLARLEACANHPRVGEARGVGLMGALEVVHDKETKAPYPTEDSIGEKIAGAALENGLICRPIGQAVILAPPFIISPGELDELFDKLYQTLSQVLPE
jgi:4-aminobutyrate--pyruvate transaminase